VLAVGKTLKTIAMVAAGVALVVFAAPIAAAIGVTAISAGTIAALGISLALSSASTALFTPKIPKSQLSRLNVALDPSTPRKAVFGTTAMPLDLRYHESSGTDQEYVDYIVAVAAHKVGSIDEIWFEEKQAWTLAGGTTSTYNGYLTVTVRTEGTASNTIAINGGGKWGSSRRLTGCAYVHIRIKRTGNSKKAESPLVGGLPSRVTIIGNGAPLYDPRQDNRVPGGTGDHSAEDQSTWGDYTDADDTDNPALQLLWWLLGWKIEGKLSIGCGVPYTRIDMESFITAANICDESVTLATGGTQKRYRTSGTASDADDRMDIINNFLMSMNGTLRDSGGKLTLSIMQNDLADYVLEFDENDMLGEFDWQQTRGLTENYNIARGRFIDPSQNSLYQMVDYPEVGFASPDGVERVMSVDLYYVEDGRRAQRIAKQILQRNQYRGMFSAVFNAKALGCQVGDVVRLNLEALGWSNKPFRVVSQEIRFDGQVPLALVEENAAIYAWDRDDVAPVTPTAPTVYNPLNSPFILGIDEALDAGISAQATADGKIESFYQTSMPTTGSEGDLWIDTDDGNKMYRHNGITFIEIQDDGISTAIVAASDAQATADGKVTTFVSETSPTAEAIGDLWFKASTGELRRWNGSVWGNALVDLTGVAVPSLDQIAPLSFAADYLGALSAGQLPKTFGIVRRRGGDNVSSSTTWSIVSQAGITGGTVTISTDGVVTIPTGVSIGTTSRIEVRSVRDGTTLDAVIGVTRNDAAPPSTGSGGGTTVNDSTFNSIDTTTFVSISDTMTIKTGASGQIQFSANLALTCASEEPAVEGSDANVEMKWRFRTVGGSFADAATAVSSNPDPRVFFDAEFSEYFSVDGYINCGPTKTGLSADTDYEVDLVARRTNSTPTKVIFFIGTASAVGS
jgi:hypothetical protein